MLNFKKISIVLLATGVVLTGCSTKESNSTTQQKKEIKTISLEDFTKNLNNSEYQFVDTRSDEAYNGFKEDNIKNGGHIKNSIQYSASFIGKVNKNKEEKFISDKGIDKNKKVVVYDTNKDNVEKVSDKLSSFGYDVYKFEDYKQFADNDSNKDSLISYPEYQNLVSASWVKDLQDGKKPETYTNNNYAIYEVSWGEGDKAVNYKEHIKGAYHFNTDWIEDGPVWNLRSADEIKANLLKQGITSDKTIILYSDDASAAFRVNWALKWAGVKDVRVMNGNLKLWKEKGYETEQTVNTPKEETNFGVDIPAHPEYNISRAKEMSEKVKNEGIKLVSIRSWDEYLGKTSGYDYIEKAGEPEGAIFGFSGENKADMSDYYDPDETLRNPQEIYNLWKGQGISETDKIALYCGTGWRNSIPWFMTQLTGRANTYFYDGGWNDWQLDGSLPVADNKDKGQKPDSKNDYK
ncbi:rhodanese-like domain-containing protein [Gemella cuniculi]|uniref:rhodanese-like domain-containing protein n=1 Tax=Gemella cuniculi TaxID=150240 RepID=UPI000414EA09|nr:rhodanese-like domain-containing protein [Gemella cuniculi]